MPNPFPAWRDALEPLCDDVLYFPAQEAQGKMPRPPQHVGLVVMRYLPTQEDNEERNAFYAALAASEPRACYRRALKRWTEQAALRDDTRLFRGTLTTSLAVGLGQDTPTEVGLTTHHTYGTPMIPGSAIKGICRQGLAEWCAQAEIAGDKVADVERVIFGNTNVAGCCVFWDAWFENGTMFQQDIVTVHHPDYYRSSGGAEWPTDFDDPTPVPFLVTPPGAQFVFGVDTPPGWQELVVSLIQWCLKNKGVGGKRNAGYGYFAFADDAMLPFPRLETYTERYLLRSPDGVTITDLNEQDDQTLTLTSEKVSRLTQHWTEEQRNAEAAMVTLYYRVIHGSEPILLRLDWTD